MRSTPSRAVGSNSWDWVLPSPISGQPLPTLRRSISCAIYLLRDGHIDVDHEGILLAPPATTISGSDDPAAAKQSLRQSFAFARRAQLAEPSVGKFVRTMEQRGVGRVFADGSEVEERLSSALQGPSSIAEAIRPSLELVTPDARDEETGLRLQEIWRYARYFWSIPYQSTPGRNMFYLVRDDAGPGRPVIGIAALGNPILGLAQRDDYLGWSVDSLRRRLYNSDERQRRRIARHLREVLDRDIASIYASDLGLPERPDESTVDDLRAIERDAAESRRRTLTKVGDARTDEYHLIRAAHDRADGSGADAVDWEAVARTDLYRRKRASTLADLLQADLVLRDALSTGPAALVQVMDTSKGASAVDVALATHQAACDR